MPEKSIKLHITSRVVSGAFSDGKLSSKGPNPKAAGEAVMRSRDSLTVMIEPSGTNGAEKTIAIDDDADKGLTAFMSVKEKNKDGYVELATITIATQQVNMRKKDAAGEMLEYYIDTNGSFTQDVDADNPQHDCSTDADADTEGFQVGAGCYDRNSVIFSAATGGNETVHHDLYDLDGELIDEGLRGNFMVNAKGTRELFNEDDVLFVDYDGDKKKGGSEEIVIDDDMGTGSALSINADTFPDAVTGTFKVYYMPGGKVDINHGSTIKLTVMVDYSDPSANDESAPKPSTTTLKFAGVTSEVDAYAIPQSGNGKGDMANVRVRCETTAGCRVFLECWDDMGERDFGQAGMIAGNALMKWDSMGIEDVIGVEDAMSRHSCRILSAGVVKVQQLTRDGSSGTLVNNTYIGE